MLAAFDRLLRTLFRKTVAGITTDAHVSFQPPDQDWRSQVSGLGTALNAYLVELRENRGLRSNERTRQTLNGVTFDTPVPRRIDGHYLITAWSTAVESPGTGVERTVIEQDLLYQVTRALLANQPLVPADVYAPDPVPADLLVPGAAEINTVVLPGEGFPKYAEFWGTMGNLHPWKPAVYVIATLPVVAVERPSGVPVTTVHLELEQTDRPGSAERLTVIGGTVRGTAGAPVAGVWVRLETLAGRPVQETQSDGGGQFILDRVTPGKYRLRYRKAGFTEQTTDIEVPSLTAAYDVTLA